MRIPSTERVWLLSVCWGWVSRSYQVAGVMDELTTEFFQDPEGDGISGDGEAHFGRGAQSPPHCILGRRVVPDSSVHWA